MVSLSPFYSAPSIFAVFRNLVREIWFEKSGSKNLVRDKWLTRKKVVLYYKSSFFQVGEKWLTRKKNPSLQNHFSRTTFLHFCRKVVADKCYTASFWNIIIHWTSHDDLTEKSAENFCFCRI